MYCNCLFIDLLPSSSVEQDLCEVRDSVFLKYILDLVYWLAFPAEPQWKHKNTGVGSWSLFQWIFPTQESNQGLLPCRQILYQLSYQGSPLSTPEIWLISKRWEANEVGLMDQTAAQNSTHKLEAMKNRSRAGCAVSVNVAVIGNWGAVRIMGSHLECIEQPDDSILPTPTLCPTPPPIRIKHFLLDCSRQLVWMLKLVLLVLMVTSDK